MATKNTQVDIRAALIRAGVKNCHAFGYPYTNEANILTDDVYKKFFLAMLKAEENITGRPSIEKERLKLIEELS